MGMIALYLIAIVAANVSVATFGPSASIVNAFLFIGLDLTSRDTLHERWQGKHLLRNMALLIATGSILSAILDWNAGRIALASFCAFAASATADSIAYSALHHRTHLAKVNGSNLVSAGVDSAVFPVLAFGWPPLFAIVAGQFAAKVAGGFLWSLVLRRSE